MWDKIIKTICAIKLYLRECRHSAAQKFLNILRWSSCFIKIEQDCSSQILLEICHPVIAHCQDFRYIDSLGAKMRCQT